MLRKGISYPIVVLGLPKMKCESEKKEKK